jgi:mRNA interferase RelE/StbE
MSYNIEFNIEFSRKAFNDLKSLTKLDQKKIIEKLFMLKKPQIIFASNKIRKLKSFKKNIYRLRVGNFRIIYTISNNILIILRIINRKDLDKILNKI